MLPTARLLTALCCASLLALGCQKSKESAPPSATETASGSKAAPAQPQRLKWTPGMVPTAAEADMALSLGKLLFEQAKFDEAEEQLKIASAGGESDADPLLLRARAELSAKEHVAVARQALAAKDFATAERELTAIPEDSVLRSVADEMLEKLEAAREKKSEELQERAIESMREELGKDFVPARKPDAGDGSGAETNAGGHGDRASEANEREEPAEE